jgi:hypothetical protein
MAEVFTQEGLTRILNIYPRTGTTSPDATLYLSLFTSYTASTVGANTVTFGTTPTGSYVEETSTGGYARASIAAAAWAAPTVSGGGVRTTTSSAIAFAASSGAYAAAINGFAISTASAAGSTDVSIGMANFSDTTAVTVNAAGFTVRVTPTWHFDS